MYSLETRFQRVSPPCPLVWGRSALVGKQTRTNQIASGAFDSFRRLYNRRWFPSTEWQFSKLEHSLQVTSPLTDQSYQCVDSPHCTTPAISFASIVRTWRPLAVASAECCRGWEEAHEVRLQPAKGKTNVHFDGKIMENLNISKLIFCKALEKDRRNTGKGPEKQSN